MRRKNKNIEEIAREGRHSKSTVVKYLKRPNAPPSNRDWTTRKNPFEEIDGEIESMFRINPGIEAKALFEHLQEKYPGKFQDGQLRSLQRRLKRFRAEIGPAKPVTFTQEHSPGELSSSDFTNMNSLEITIAGEPFDHLLYHFVLTYSNWEWGRICFSESLESLRAGLRECLLRAGGTTKEHLTDNLTAAVHNIRAPGTFKDRYQEILNAFGLKGRTIQPGCPQENGDIEQRHYRLKKAIEQSLLLRGSRNFENRGAYEAFLHKIFYKLNRNRQEKVDEESCTLKPLPEFLVPDYSAESARVSSCSTIRVRSCSYSVPSRLIGEEVALRIYDDKIEVWYAQKLLQSMERLRGQNKHKIDYRHIIESLKRKPGAFANYRYRDCLYPTSNFKLTYEHLQRHFPQRATKAYIEVLSIAAQVGESRVERTLSYLLKGEEVFTFEQIQELVTKGEAPDRTEIAIAMPKLEEYDQTFGLGGSAC